MAIETQTEFILIKSLAQNSLVILALKTLVATCHIFQIVGDAFAPLDFKYRICSNEVKYILYSLQMSYLALSTFKEVDLILFGSYFLIPIKFYFIPANPTDVLS